ncbi:YfhO family protein [Dyella psychrodurans]|nr:YfhO family protein [Dyella psychrodurans]
MSNRTAVPLAASAGASLDLSAFISMFAPNGLHTFQGTYDGPASLVESYLYIGVVPMLSLFGMARALKERKLRRPVIFFIVLTVLATLYVMGTNTPFYRWLYTWLPGLTHFRRPADAAYLLNLAFAVIVGLCAAQIDLQSRDEITLLLACTAGWLALIAAQMHEHRFGLFGCAALAALALWRLRKPGSEWRATAWLIAVLVVDYSGLNLNGRFSAMNDTTRVFQRSKAVQYLQKDLNDNAGVMPWRIATQNTSTTWDNGVVLSGLSSTQGYNPLRIANYQHWYAPRESSNAHRIDNPLNASPDYTLDKLLGVKFLVMGHRTDLQAVSPPSTYTRVFGDEDVDIWRNDDTYPHVLNPQHAMFVAADQPMDASTFSSTNFHDTVWLTPRDEEDSRNDRVAAATCTGQAAAHATRWEPTQATMAVHASHAGWLVVDDLDFAGWRAQIDGVPLPIHRANGMFRAVCVPAGDHELQFTFHPLLMVADAWSHRRT